MKKRPLYLIPLFILVILLSGCLPKIPKKITGPTLISKYTLPLIGEKIVHLETSEDGEGLGLEGFAINYQASSEDDHKLKLIEEKIKISFGSFEPAELELKPLPGMSFNFEIQEQTIGFSLGEIGDFLQVTLSNNPDYNKIDFSFGDGGATAGEEGLTLKLRSGDQERTGRIEPGTTDGRLDLTGMSLNPNEIVITASGTVFIPGGAEKVGLNLEPSDLEIKSFIVAKDSFDEITEHFASEDEELLSIDLPSESDDFALRIQNALLEYTPDEIPENLVINPKLKISGEDADGNEKIHETLNLPFDNQSTTELDITDLLNQILEDKPCTLKLEIIDLVPTAKGDIALTCPAEINLRYDVNFALAHFIYSPSEGLDLGKMEIPDDAPLEIESGKIWFEIANDSPAGLGLEVWLSPNPFDNWEDPGSSPSSFKNELNVEPNKTTTSILELTKEQYSNLTSSDDNQIYSFIKINNLTPTTEKIGDDDTLEISAWAQVEIKVNPR